MKCKGKDTEKIQSLEETEHYTALSIQNVPENIGLSKIMHALRSTDVLSLERTGPKSAELTLFSYFDMFRTKERMGGEVHVDRHVLPMHPCRTGLGSAERERLYMAHCAGGTRNVMLGNLEDFMDDGFIREEAEKYGKIDSFKYFRDRKVSYIEFFSFISAIKFVSGIHEDSLFQNVRIAFGKDKCNAEETEGSITNNRTVYFGNIPMDTSAADILEAVRGGSVFSMKLIKEKKCAFITFIDSISAAALIEYASVFSVFIKGIPIKVGSGKVMPLPHIAPILAYNNTSRILAFQLSDAVSSIQLEMELSKYGEIEGVEKKDGALLVSFTNMHDAYNACTDLAKTNPAIAVLFCGYKEDPCGAVKAKSLIMQIQRKELS
ncbi:hypothetical protein NECID01_1389 [Nematocida sp. AWRm77]|nr:hypothetical protein NECID01_1389 [Nematocida sp. AWRm77]